MIKDEFKRGVLAEGRNFGFGFSILEKKEDRVFNALMPFTACKDYLNDFVYVETTGNDLSQVYGFKHNYVGVLKNKECFYLGVKPLHFNHSQTKWNQYDELTELLANNTKNLLIFLNKLEEYFGVEALSEVESNEDGTLIIKVSIFWSRFSFLTSLYTLYIRYFIKINEEDLKQDIKTIISTYTNLLITEDNMLFQCTKKLLDENYYNNLLEYEYPKEVTSNFIHNFGIGSRIQDLNTKLAIKKTTVVV